MPARRCPTCGTTFPEHLYHEHVQGEVLTRLGSGAESLEPCPAY